MQSRPPQRSRRRSRPRRSPLPAVAFALCLLAACGGTEGARERPNVLLVTVDTLRADHCSTAGYERDTTPRLKQLAAEGARFELAYAPAASTAPSHASLFTSHYPLRHGLAKNGQRLAEEADTLAERLAAAGYETAGVVSSFVLDAKFGLAQGFEHYDDDFTAAEAGAFVEATRRWEGHDVEGSFDRRGDHTTDRAVAWLRGRESGRPFFLFVHYFDPHLIYRAPEPFGTRWVTPAMVPGSPAGERQAEPGDDAPLARELNVAFYDGEISFVDHHLGRLTDALRERGLLDSTLLVVTSDHGEGLMEHGVLSHAVNVYEEAVRVPLVVRYPGVVAAGRVVGGPVELVDLMPTILALAGLAPSGLEGRDLSPVLRGRGALDPERAVYLHRRPYERARVSDPGGGTFWLDGRVLAIRRGRWKYLEGRRQGVSELYDLAADPAEAHNLAPAEPATAARLATELRAWRQAQRGLARAPLGGGLTAEDRARLEALGYHQD